MKPIVIIGAGGFGREVLQLLRDQNAASMTWDIWGFVDDKKELQGKTINGVPVLGLVDWLKNNKRGNPGCICAIGDCHDRKRVVEKVHEMGITFYNAIHPSVIMSESVEVGHDVIICAGSILTVNIRISDHVHVDTNCTIAHDAVVESYCRLGPGARINGKDRLGEGVYIGTGATLIQQISVGSWSTIGAGAAVVKNIPKNSVAVGVPARVVRSTKGTP